MFAFVSALAVAPPAHAQVNAQIWTNVTFTRLSTERVSYELDLEPKGQVTDTEASPRWVNLDATPGVAYAAAGWMDIVGELTTGYTRQSDGLGTIEVTPRLGIQWSILSRVIRPRMAARRGVDLEKIPRRRAVVSTLVRVERRTFAYSDETPSGSSWRIRDRVEFDYPLNRPKLTDDGVVYTSADGELFMPLGSATDAGRISQVRARAGVGYRRSFGWRFEALGIWTGNRDEGSHRFSVSSFAVDVRLRHVF